MGRSVVNFGLECMNENFIIFYVHSDRTNLQAACLVKTPFNYLLYCRYHEAVLLPSPILSYKVFWMTGWDDGVNLQHALTKARRYLYIKKSRAVKTKPWWTRNHHERWIFDWRRKSLWTPNNHEETKIQINNLCNWFPWNIPLYEF